MDQGAVDLDGRLTDVAGITVGHWSDPIARTGCTVVIVPEGTVGSGEVRGGGPATREFALLDPTRHVSTIDAVVLTGGSAFGLASAEGVMAHLEDVGRGYVTSVARVPIVPTMGVFDLAVGDPTVRPGSSEGRFAAVSAVPDRHEIGAVGVGTGCTTDKVRGIDHARPGGIVAASTQVSGVTVACLIAVNAVGAVGASASVPGGADGTGVFGRAREAENTTIGVVATSARLDKLECHLLAQSAHDGLARSVFPTHTRFDGDAFVACATGSATPQDSARVGIDALRVATVAVVEGAIRTLTEP